MIPNEGIVEPVTSPGTSTLVIIGTTISVKYCP